MRSGVKPRKLRRRYSWYFIVAAVLTLVLISSGDQNTRTFLSEDFSFSVGACITGQLCRLELESKRRYFFKAVQDSEHELFVSMVLQEHSTCRHTNKAGSLEPSSKFRTLDEVGDWLTRNHIFGSVVSSTEVVPFYHDRYLYSLDKRGLVDEKRRALHHNEQWTNLKSCWNELEKQGKFDAYVKLRDDSVFVAKFSPLQSVQAYLGTTNLQDVSELFVPACLGWGGMNDKAAVVLGSAAREFFNAPIEVYKSHYNELTCDKGHCGYIFNTYNPESFLQQAMEYKGIPISYVPPELFPFLTGVPLLGAQVLCFPNGFTQTGQDHECLPKRMRILFRGCIFQYQFIMIFIVLLISLVVLLVVLARRPDAVTRLLKALHEKQNFTPRSSSKSRSGFTPGTLKI